MEKTNQIISEEVRRKSLTINELSTKLESLKNEFDVKMKRESLFNGGIKRQEVESAAAQIVSAAIKDHERDVVQLRHNNAELRTKNLELSESNVLFKLI